jgi:hypothetical protein
VRNQHQGLFNNAVKPGFDALVLSGDINNALRTAGKKIVPTLAECQRENDILTAFQELKGESAGSSLWEAITPAATGDMYQSPKCDAVLFALRLAP